MCEIELNFLDTAINYSKTCCMRIGPRCAISCANISTRDGRTLSWVSELRYLGILIVKSRNFKCSLSNAKCNFYRAVNGIFSRIINFASEEVIIELITRKCMPILLYSLESCQLSNGDLHSLDFTYNRMCMKLFKSSNIELIKEYRGYSLILKVVLIFLVLQIKINIVIRDFWICKVDIFVAFIVIETLHVTV